MQQTKITTTKNNSTQISLSNANFFTQKYSKLALYVTNVNKKPLTKIEKRLFSLREKIIKNNRTPHPLKTTNIIYCIYSIKKSAKKLYIELTRNSAFSRLLQHLTRIDKTPIHKYIQFHKPENFSVFVLEFVPLNKSLNTYKRNWILKLQTQINSSHPENLNYLKENTISRSKILTKPKIIKPTLTNTNQITIQKETQKYKNKKMFRT